MRPDRHRVCSQHAHELNWTELQFGTRVSQRECSQRTNWHGTSRPSFAAANQVVKLQASCIWVDLLQVRPVQFLCCERAFINVGLDSWPSALIELSPGAVVKRMQLELSHRPTSPHYRLDSLSETSIVVLSACVWLMILYYRYSSCDMRLDYV